MKKSVRTIVNDETGLSLFKNPLVMKHIFKYAEQFNGNPLNLFLTKNFVYKKNNIIKNRLTFMRIKVTHPRFPIIYKMFD